LMRSWRELTYMIMMGFLSITIFISFILATLHRVGGPRALHTGVAYQASFLLFFFSLCLLSACMVYKSTDCTSTSFWVRISNQIKSIEKERKEDFGWVFNAKLLYL
jgi:hypothetical protein